MPRLGASRYGNMRRSSNRRRRMFRRRRPTLARRVTRISRVLRALPRPERKHMDTFGTSIALLNNFVPANCIFPCRNISQGDSDFGERVGDQISLSSYTLNMNLQLDATQAYDIVTVTVLQFKSNPDGATSQTSFVNMYYNSATDNSLYNPLALVDWDNFGSFRLLYKKSFNLTPNAAIGATPATASAGQRVTVKIKFPKVGKLVQFFNNGSVPSKNELFVLLTSRSDSITTCQYTDRLVYTDA